MLKIFSIEILSQSSIFFFFQNGYKKSENKQWLSKMQLGAIQIIRDTLGGGPGGLAKMSQNKFYW